MTRSRYLPIIYVRGFAATQGEMDQTTADPFNGFNLGSTVYRAVPDKKASPRKYVFESPVVRLMSGFGYKDVYEDGSDILDPEWERNALGEPTENRLRARSIIIHRYYDECSTLLGTGKDPSIKEFARKLGQLIIKVRDLLASNPDSGIHPDEFGCYLVAHSMGGLVCRALLQNRSLDPHNAARYVEKLFTFATPHNGIDVLGTNVPGWLKLLDVDVFNRQSIAKLMGIGDLYGKTEATQRADLIDDRCPLKPDRVFCMVGTNRMDYEAFAGLSRAFVGQGSDGLVRIANATLTHRAPDGTLTECAKAFAFRSHSGYFGIVNSEEAFQNLARFLFGDLRVDVFIDIDEIRLPAALQKRPRTTQIDALYQIEMNAAPRGKMWFLTRRTVEEDSVACISHKEWTSQPGRRRLYLSSVFLANRAKVTKGTDSLAYAMSLGIRVPDYEIDRKFWINEHYEGAYLFRNALVVEIFGGTTPGDTTQVTYSWQDSGVSGPKQVATLVPQADGSHAIMIPFDSTIASPTSPETPTTPGIKGHVVLKVRRWNADLVDDLEAG